MKVMKKTRINVRNQMENDEYNDVTHFRLVLTEVVGTFQKLHDQVIRRMISKEEQ